MKNIASTMAMRFRWFETGDYLSLVKDFKRAVYHARNKPRKSSTNDAEKMIE